VVVKATEVLHQAGERYFARMPKRGVAKIVGKTNCLNQILVGTQGPRKCPTDLSDFQGMGEAGAEVVAFEIDEDLGLIFEPSKRGGMKDAVAVALERGPIFRFIIQIGTTLCVFT